jgi:hypothetical protein
MSVSFTKKLIEYADESGVEIIIKGFSYQPSLSVRITLRFMRYAVRDAVKRHKKRAKEKRHNLFDHIYISYNFNLGFEHITRT